MEPYKNCIFMQSSFPLFPQIIFYLSDTYYYSYTFLNVFNFSFFSSLIIYAYDTSYSSSLILWGEICNLIFEVVRYIFLRRSISVAVWKVLNKYLLFLTSRFLTAQSYKILLWLIRKHFSLMHKRIRRERVQTRVLDFDHVVHKK